MKKSNKRIPKTLPKYGVGMETPVGGDSTTNIYNQKRSMNQTSNGQYLAAAGALTQGGANMANIYGDSQSTNRQKADSFDDTARATTSAINPVIGTAIGVGDMIGKPIRKNLEATDPVTGEVKNRQNVKTGAAIGMFFDPGKWIGHIANGGLGDISGNKYVDDIEANAKAEIAAKNAQQAEYAQQQDAERQQQARYNLMFQDYQNRGTQQSTNPTIQYSANGGIQYANGGNGQINAEVEKQENSVAPDGEFTQFNGPSHANGGIKSDIPGGSKIFSDKLKAPGTKKTFAELNKPNNTNKEDKILESNKHGNISKHTAMLMSMAKNKNSDALFNEQEALKQAKVEAYAKKMGVILPQPSMDNESMEPQGMSEASEGEYASGGIHIDPSKRGTFTAAATKHGKSVQEFASQVLANKENYSPAMVKKANFAHNAAGWKHEMGGVQLPYYNINNDGTPKYPYGGPIDNTKFTPGQRQQAYSDSMTLYKSGFDKNVPNNIKEAGFNDAVLRLTDLNKQSPTSTDKRPITVNEAYLQGHSVPYAKPIAPITQSLTSKTKPTYANYNMPMQGLERPDNFNPQLQQVPANSPNTIKTNIVTGPNMSYKEYKQGNQVLDRGYFDPSTRKEIELGGFKNGGKMPKYEDGTKTPNDINSLTPRQQGEYNMWFNANRENENFNPDEYSVDTYKNQYLYDAPTNTTPQSAKLTNNTTPEISDKQRGNINWGNVAMQGANFAAQNAGNIYNLSRYNKPEIENYERLKATYLDPTAAMRDAEAEARRAEYNVRGASGGNAGTYLANRVGLNTQNILNKDRIRQQYANANAGIANQIGQYNTELSRAEVIANAQNRARTRSGKGEAIGSMGSNIANQMIDNKKGDMDQETLQLMMKYYNDPQFKKYLEESGFNKKKTGK